MRLTPPKRSISHVASKPAEKRCECLARVPELLCAETMDELLRCASELRAVPERSSCGKRSAELPSRFQRACMRRSLAIANDRLFDTAVATRFVSIGSSKRHHQHMIDSDERAMRGSSLAEAGANSPVAVLLVVGYPASGGGAPWGTTSGST